MALPQPEPTEPVHDAVFAQLKADVLEGLAEADAGLTIPAEEAWQSIRAYQAARKRSCPE